MDTNSINEKNNYSINNISKKQMYLFIDWESKYKKKIKLMKLYYIDTIRIHDLLINNFAILILYYYIPVKLVFSNSIRKVPTYTNL